MSSSCMPVAMIMSYVQFQDGQVCQDIIGSIFKLIFQILKQDITALWAVSVWHEKMWHESSRIHAKTYRHQIQAFRCVQGGLVDLPRAGQNHRAPHGAYIPSCVQVLRPP